jgi:hypothetical protein
VFGAKFGSGVIGIGREKRYGGMPRWMNVAGHMCPF